MCNKMGPSSNSETTLFCYPRVSAPKSDQILLFTFFRKVRMLNAPQLFIGQKSWRYHMTRCVFHPHLESSGENRWIPQQ
jgi:hypothetical protein